VKNAKRHPEAMYKTLDFFGIEPQECLYIGDWGWFRGLSRGRGTLNSLQE